MVQDSIHREGKASRTLAAAVLLAVLGLLLPARLEGAVTTPVQDLRPGQFFHGPIRLRVPLLGVTFSVPAPWRARLPAGSQVVHLDSSRRPGIGVVLLLSQVTLEDVRARLNEPLAFEEAYTLDPASPVQQDGRRLSARYLHGDQVGRAVAVLGPTDQAMIYLMAGPDTEAAHFDEVVAALADSTRYLDRSTTERLTTWYDRLQGTRLERASPREITVWHLCSDGQFLYEFRRPGAPPQEAGFEEAGPWRIDVQDDRIVLVVQPQLGIPRVVPLEHAGEAVVLDGKRYARTRSNRCF